jgi:hypothetical protein
MKALVFYAFLVALVASVAVQAQSPAGGEFRVNDFTASTQRSPAVALDASGRFVVVWSTYPNGQVRGRRFSPAGVPLAAEFLVNTPGLSPSSAAVGTDVRGRFVVAWEQYDGNGRGVFARRFTASGYAGGDPFRANAYVTGNQHVPSVAMLAGGAFVVVWYSGAGDGDGNGIFGRIFDASGVPVQAADFRVNTYTTGSQYAPSVAALGQNRFVVVWNSANQDGSSGGVFGQRYDGPAALGAEFRVNGYTTGNQFAGQVVPGSQGGFVGVWQDGATLWGRRFDASGAPVGGDFTVNTAPTQFPQITNAAANAVGDFTVVWDTAYTYEVQGRRFTPSGVPRGAVFQANTYTTITGQPFPNVGSDPSGNIVVTWRSNQFASPAHFDVYGQRYGGLVPTGLAVTDGANGVLEVPDDFGLLTSWRNVSGVAQTFQGQAASVTVPPGLLLTLSTNASYGTVANGAVGSCTGACFAGTLVGPRPAGHVDLGVVERILPDAQGQAKSWAVHVGESFTDVPRTSAFYRLVETLLHHGVTSGCGGNAYCPAAATTREQMAVFLLTAKEGAGYVPRACATPVFGDVPAASPFCRFIEELARRGVTSGCGGGNFCPAGAVTREQMAVFVLRTLEPLSSPPLCNVPVFGDVPATSPFCPWIEELARRGVVGGCGGGNYCPLDPVTREQMSVFITVTFGLTLYGP